MKSTVSLFFLIVIGTLTLYFAKPPWSLNLMGKNSLETFSDEELKTEIKSYFTQIHGVQKIQLAELMQNEKITQTSHKKVFWQKLELPTIVVSIEVPVNYTYYIDLKKNWSIEQLDSGDIQVVTSALEFNPPAANISKMAVKNEKGSLFRSEQEVVDKLISKLSEFLNDRGHEHIDLVRESARLELQNLIEKWFQGQRKTSQRVRVIFADEVPPEDLSGINGSDGF